MSIFSVVLILMGLCGFNSGLTVISPFQVSIRLYDNFHSNNTESINLCSGAIIHESYILTTAHCMHSHVLSANISRQYLPGMIYIVAGDFSDFATNMRLVSSIFVHERYNKVTLDNDIALLKVDEPFFLYNNDVKWIELDDKTNTRPDYCYTSFHNESSTGYPFTSPQYSYIMDNWFCSKNSSYARKHDVICTSYMFNNDNMCKKSPAQLELSNDRGTPLVCNNRLTGLLSTILSPINATLNSTTAQCPASRKTWAIYTKVASYSEWIHMKINRQQQHTADGFSVIPQVTSPPFQTPSQHTPAYVPPTPPPPPKKSSGCSQYFPTTSARMAATFSLFITIPIYMSLH